MPWDDFHPTYLRLQESGEAVIAEPRFSQLTDEENIGRLGEELFALVEQYHCRHIVLNLAPVEHMTSAMLGKLISLHRKAHRHDGKLVLCGLDEKLREVVQTARLSTYFNLAESLDEALASLSR